MYICVCVTKTPLVVAETASVYQGEGASLYTSFLDVGSGAGAHYLPTLKSGEQIAREKDTVAGELRPVDGDSGKKRTNNGRN